MVLSTLAGVHMSVYLSVCSLKNFCSDTTVQDSLTKLYGFVGAGIGGVEGGKG